MLLTLLFLLSIVLYLFYCDCWCVSPGRTQAVQDVQMADLSLRVDIVDVKSTSGVLVRFFY